MEKTVMFAHEKDITKLKEGQKTNWEKKFATYMAEKDFVSLVCKGSHEKDSYSVGRGVGNVRDLNSHFLLHKFKMRVQRNQVISSPRLDGQ